MLRLLPRTELNKIDLSLEKRKYNHGQYACVEGNDSEHIFIILNGEFEVSKVIDTNEQNQAFN